MQECLVFFWACQVFTVQAAYDYYKLSTIVFRGFKNTNFPNYQK